MYGLRSHEGFWRFLVLRHSAALDHWMVNIVTAWEAQDQVLTRGLNDLMRQIMKDVDFFAGKTP